MSRRELTSWESRVGWPGWLSGPGDRYEISGPDFCFENEKNGILSSNKNHESFFFHFILLGRGTTVPRPGGAAPY